MPVVGAGRFAWVGFEPRRLARGEAFAAETGGDELCRVDLAGRVRVNDWEVGGRADPFEGPPESVYLPPGAGFEVEALEEAELGLCRAAARRGAPAGRCAARAAMVRGQGSTSASCTTS